MTPQKKNTKLVIWRKNINTYTLSTMQWSSEELCSHLAGQATELPSKQVVWGGRMNWRILDYRNSKLMLNSHHMIYCFTASTFASRPTEQLGHWQAALGGSYMRTLTEAHVWAHRLMEEGMSLQILYIFIMLFMFPFFRYSQQWELAVG
jgi:hypothetical protein